jgi:hypothetical protein
MRVLKSKAPLFLFCCALIGVSLTACGGAPATTPPATIAPTPATGGALSTSTAPAALDQGSYPPPETAAEVTDPYPADGQPALPATETPLEYPPSAAEETFLEPRFRIDQPVAANATTITGQAPPNLTLAVLDVSYNGTPLGIGQSDESGRFSIPVTGLIAGNRIGLAIGELPEGLSIAQTAEQYFPYRGEGFQNLPNLGVFYDTALVQP